MLTSDEIAVRKAKLSSDPETKKICKLLGISVERFLEDIEHQWAHCEVLIDENRGSITIDDLASIAEACVIQNKQDLRMRAGQADRIFGMNDCDRELSVRRAIGDDDWC